MLSAVTYAGMSCSAAAAVIAYHGAPPTTSRTRARMVNELNAGNDVPLIEPTKPAYSAPKIPAKNAEMQNTMTRVRLMVVPCVSSASGESDSARRIRPSRPRVERDDDDRTQHRGGEHHVVVPAVALADARARRVHPGRRRAEHDVLRVEHVLEHDPEARGSPARGTLPTGGWPGWRSPRRWGRRSARRAAPRATRECRGRSRGDRTRPRRPRRARAARATPVPTCARAGRARGRARRRATAIVHAASLRPTRSGMNTSTPTSNTAPPMLTRGGAVYAVCGGGGGGGRRRASSRRGVTSSATKSTMNGMLTGRPPSHVMSLMYFVESAAAMPMRRPPT